MSLPRPPLAVTTLRTPLSPLPPAVPPTMPAKNLKTRFTAEVLAIFWALVWIAESGYRYQVPIHVCYGCTSAGGGSFGRSAPPGQGGASTLDAGELSKATVLMRQVASAVATVYEAHVKGHSGIFRNEIADKLAKAACKSGFDSSDRWLPKWPADMLTHEPKAWAWLALGQAADLPFLFSLQSEACTLQGLDRPAPPPPAAQVLAPDEIALQLAVVSYNALTLWVPLPRACVLPQVSESLADVMR